MTSDVVTKPEPAILDQQAAGITHAEIDRRVMRGSAWIAASYGGRIALNMLSMLVLARLLNPSAFGVTALATTLLYFFYQIQESGIGAALIYHRRNIREAAAAGFWFSLGSSLALFAAAFVVAPFAAQIFHAHHATAVFRAMAGVILLRGIGVVPEAIIEREVAFHVRAIAEGSAAVIQAGVAIGLAAAGAGVWGLVIGALAAQAAQTTLMWWRVPWRPAVRTADFLLLHQMLRYGRLVSATNVLILINTTVDNITVGGILGPAAVGLYNVAYRLGDAPATVVGYIVGRVMFPIYAMLQGNLPALRRVYLQNLQRVALFSLPLSVAFVVAAHPIVLALLGPKWEGATTALQILAAFGLLKSFAGPSGEVFRGIGKPHFGLAIAAGQIPLVVPLLIALTQSGRITGTAIAMLIGMGTIAPISLALTSRAIDLPVRQMVYAVAPSAVCAAIAGAVLAVVAGATHSLTPALSLVVLVITGGFTYIVSTALIARAAVTSMWSALRPARDHPERLQSTG